MAEEPAEVVALIALRKDGSAAILKGDSLEDYLDAEGRFLSQGIHHNIFRPIAEQYALALDYMYEAIWARDWDKIIINDQEELLDEIEHMEEVDVPQEIRDKTRGKE